MPGKYHIRRGFHAARIGVQISADNTGGLARDKLPSVIRLPDNFIACAEIDNNGGACRRMRKGWRGHDPKVLADFRTNRKLRYVSGTENQLCSERNALAKQRNDAVVSRRRRKIAFLIKLPVIGKMGFRDHSENFPVTNGSGAVIKLSHVAQRSADKDKHARAAARISDSFQSLYCRVGKPA